MTHRQILSEATDRLEKVGIDEASTDAWVLFEYVFQMNRTQYFMRSNEPADDLKVEEYRKLIERRAGHEPLQYITGKAYFMGLEFMVNPSVLIPRYDTEILVEETLKHISDGSSILDVCTGSGCIAISLGILRKKCTVTGIDISKDALKVAETNKLLNKSDNDLDDTLDNVTFMESDMFSNVTEQYDIIVSNPPYIKSAEVDVLMPEVVGHEPRLALDGMEDGLHFYKILAAQSQKFLKDNGLLIMEIGYDQAEDVSRLLENNNFTDITVIRDLAGHNRVVCGRRK